MTTNEQNHIINSVDGLSYSGWSLRKRMELWATEKYCREGSVYELGSGCGWSVQYRTATMSDWKAFANIYAQRSATESSSDRKMRTEKIRRMFDEELEQVSNGLGDVTEVRCVPYMSLHNKEKNIWEDRYNEDDVRYFPCTDTGEKREWNKLVIEVSQEPRGGLHGYCLVRNQIHSGDNISWYLPWHFALDNDAECPVAPVMVEEIDAYHLVLCYRGKRFVLQADAGGEQAAVIEEGAVTPTHNWYHVRMPEPFRFQVKATLTWCPAPHTYDNITDFQKVPGQQYRTSDLPADVRTMQQQDHDAWEEI